MHVQYLFFHQFSNFYLIRQTGVIIFQSLSFKPFKFGDLVFVFIFVSLCPINVSDRELG